MSFLPDDTNQPSTTNAVNIFNNERMDDRTAMSSALLPLGPQAGDSKVQPFFPATGSASIGESTTSIIKGLIHLSATKDVSFSKMFLDLDPYVWKFYDAIEKKKTSRAEWHMSAFNPSAVSSSILARCVGSYLTINRTTRQSL